MNLNLGCGKNTFQYETLNADLRRTRDTDVICDFDRFPYPFKDESFQNVFAIDILEHLTDVVKVVDEIHRMTKPGGVLIIRTCYWAAEQSYTDPTHKHWFNLESFDFFDPTTKWGGKYHWYTDRKWKVHERENHGNELAFKLEKMRPVELIL